MADIAGPPVSPQLLQQFSLWCCSAIYLCPMHGEISLLLIWTHKKHVVFLPALFSNLLHVYCSRDSQISLCLSLQFSFSNILLSNSVPLPFPWFRLSSWQPICPSSVHGIALIRSSELLPKHICVDKKLWCPHLQGLLLGKHLGERLLHLRL